ncbi:MULTISPECIES: hypothetical protein [Bacillus]|uniref:hypothetical protein n=1 Tax=Bacillus TaxID=1386 RepID=UPI0002E105D0|nr:MULTISPECIES: hypothetical protein [Bacillus]
MEKRMIPIDEILDLFKKIEIEVEAADRKVMSAIADEKQRVITSYLKNVGAIEELSMKDKEKRLFLKKQNSKNPMRKTYNICLDYSF